MEPKKKQRYVKSTEENSGGSSQGLAVRLLIVVVPITVVVGGDGGGHPAPVVGRRVVRAVGDHALFSGSSVPRGATLVAHKSVGKLNRFFTHISRFLFWQVRLGQFSFFCVCFFLQGEGVGNPESLSPQPLRASA